MFDATVPDFGIPGNSITVNYTLKNQGDGVANSPPVYFYLSKDTTYSDDDVLPVMTALYLYSKPFN